MYAVSRPLTYTSVALVLAVVALACLAAVQSASAAVLYDQTAGATGSSVPSQESPDEPASTQAADDILVPAGEHWEVSEVQALGSRESPGPVSFNVFLYEEGSFGPGRELFAERGVSASGPSYSLPLRGAPILNPGTYWISVQAIGAQPRKRPAHQLPQLVVPRRVLEIVGRAARSGVQADRHLRAGADQRVLRQHRGRNELAARNLLPDGLLCHVRSWQP